jgi:hypothetical protein
MKTGFKALRGKDLCMKTVIGGDYLAGGAFPRHHYVQFLAPHFFALGVLASFFSAKGVPSPYFLADRAGGARQARC